MKIFIKLSTIESKIYNPFIQKWDILKLWWFYGILLGLYHSNDPLFGTWIEGSPLLRWCVTDVLCRALVQRIIKTVKHLL